MGRALARVTRRHRLVVAVGLPALLLAAGLVWGMAAAMGASPSPSASGSPSSPASAPPSTPTTSIRSSGTAARRTRSSTSTTTSSWATRRTCRRARAGHELAGLAGRQGLDLPPAPGRALAGRQAVHGQRRGVHLRAHHQEQSHGLHELHQQHRESRGHGPVHGGHDLQPAQSQHAAPVDPHPAPARVEQGAGRLPRDVVHQPHAHSRHRAVPDRGGQEGRLREAGA